MLVTSSEVPVGSIDTYSIVLTWSKDEAFFWDEEQKVLEKRLVWNREIISHSYWNRLTPFFLPETLLMETSTASSNLRRRLAKRLKLTRTPPQANSSYSSEAALSRRKLFLIQHYLDDCMLDLTLCLVV